jgi:hypothetical protein
MIVEIFLFIILNENISLCNGNYSLIPLARGVPIGRGEKKTHPIYMREGNSTLIPLVRGVPAGRGEKKTHPIYMREGNLPLIPLM